MSLYLQKDFNVVFLHSRSFAVLAILCTLLIYNRISSNRSKNLSKIEAHGLLGGPFVKVIKVQRAALKLECGFMQNFISPMGHWTVIMYKLGLNVLNVGDTLGIINDGVCAVTATPLPAV